MPCRTCLKEDKLKEEQDARISSFGKVDASVRHLFAIAKPDACRIFRTSRHADRYQVRERARPGRFGFFALGETPGFFAHFAWRTQIQSDQNYAKFVPNFTCRVNKETFIRNIDKLRFCLNQPIRIERSSEQDRRRKHARIWAKCG